MPYKKQNINASTSPTQKVISNERELPDIAEIKNRLDTVDNYPDMEKTSIGAIVNKKSLAEAEALIYEFRKNIMQINSTLSDLSDIRLEIEINQH